MRPARVLGRCLAAAALCAGLAACAALPDMPSVRGKPVIPVNAGVPLDAAACAPRHPTP
ncbi:Type IV secretion system protein PtlE [Bordetella pseudohinzii]|nr:Type IV secretion system protein PtlE [Bordetella pseudohinzii]